MVTRRHDTIQVMNMQIGSLHHETILVSFSILVWWCVFQVMQCVSITSQGGVQSCSVFYLEICITSAARTLWELDYIWLLCRKTDIKYNPLTGMIFSFFLSSKSTNRWYNKGIPHDWAALHFLKHIIILMKHKFSILKARVLVDQWQVWSDRFLVKTPTNNLVKWMYTLRLLSVFSFMLNTSAFSYNPEPVAIYYFSPKNTKTASKTVNKH